MLSADAYRVPIFEHDPSLRRRSLPLRLHAVFSRFLRRFLGGGKVRTPSLPCDLNADTGADIGLRQPAQDRADAFWDAKRRSHGRDLPL